MKTISFFPRKGGIQLLSSHKMIKIWPPPPLSPYLHLFDFGTPLLQTFKTLHQPPSPPSTPSSLPPTPPLATHYQNNKFIVLFYRYINTCYITTPINATKIFSWYECSQCSHEYKRCLLLRFGLSKLCERFR